MDINNIQDLVDRAVSTYNQGYITNITDSKGPNDIYNIQFKPGPYALHIDSLQFCGRSVFQASGNDINAANANQNRASIMHLCAAIPQDLLTAQSLRINNKELLQTLQLQIGRNRFHNFLKYDLRDDDAEDIDPSRNNTSLLPGSGANYQAIGTAVNVNSAFLEGENLTQVTATSVNAIALDPSQMVYQKKNKFASEYVQRHYSYSVAGDTGVVQASSLTQWVPSQNVTRLANDYYSFFSVPIKDWFIELQTMGGLIDMSDKTLDIQLKVNASPNALSSFVNGLAANGTAALTTFNGTETFRLTDTTIYSRILPYKNGMESIARNYFSQPVNYLSVVQDRLAVTGSAMNLRTNINSNQILAAVIFHTVAGRAGNVAPTLPINYITDIKDSPLVSYYHESYAMPYQSCYVELQGLRYRQSDINLGNKQINFYADAQNALKEVFANKKLAMSFNQFQLNKNFIIIPINPQAYKSQVMGGVNNLANLHIEYNVQNTQFTRNPIGAGIAGNPVVATVQYDCHVFYIVSQTLMGDRVEA